jgi:hypothetical protein
MDVIFIVLSVAKLLLIVIAYALLFLLVLLAVVIFCPLSYEIAADKFGKPTINAKAQWLFGLARISSRPTETGNDISARLLFFNLGGKPRDSSGPKPERPANAKKPSGGKKVGGKKAAREKSGGLPEALFRRLSGIKDTILKVRDTAGLVLGYPDKAAVLSALGKLIADLLKALKPQKFDLRAEIGFGDPSLTGYLAGAVYIVNSCLDAKLRITPNFQQPVTDFSVFAKGRVSAARILGPIAVFLLNKPVFRHAITLLKKKRRG